MVEGERIVNTYRQGTVKNRHLAVLTTKRLIMVHTGMTGLNYTTTSIPYRSIVSVELVIGKKILGDVFVTLVDNSRRELKIFSEQAAKDLYSDLLKIIL